MYCKKKPNDNPWKRHQWLCSDTSTSLTCFRPRRDFILRVWTPVRYVYVFQCPSRCTPVASKRWDQMRHYPQNRPASVRQLIDNHLSHWSNYLQNIKQTNTYTWYKNPCICLSFVKRRIHWQDDQEKKKKLWQCPAWSLAFSTHCSTWCCCGLSTGITSVVCCPSWPSDERQEMRF